MKRKPKESITTPYVIVIDDREQAPFSFSDLRSDAREGRKPIIVQTKTTRLETADYSLEGFEGKVAVERKGLSDLFATLGSGRDRFERELQRLAAMEFSAVVLEPDWAEILERPPAGSGMRPKAIFRSIVAYQQRFPRTHWWPCGCRRLAEVTCFRILERYWKNTHRAPEKPTPDPDTEAGDP
jgi:ERCC4-type nuclease